MSYRGTFKPDKDFTVTLCILKEKSKINFIISLINCFEKHENNILSNELFILHNYPLTIAKIKNKGEMKIMKFKLITTETFGTVPCNFYRNMNDEML